MCQYRYVVASIFLEQHHELALATPALVDFDHWVHDRPETSMPEQIDLWERLIRLYGGRLHPFVAYDPLREIRSGGAAEQGSLFWVKTAIERRGFLGVKLYPPMGFRAIGNAGRPDDDVTAAEYARLDDALAELYGWCIREEVPILAHSNLTNFTSQDRKDCAHARHWRRLLEQPQFRTLRLNLGHFGDLTADSGDDQTSTIVALMTDDHPNLFADVSYHEGGLRRDDQARERYFTALTTLLTKHPVVAERLMYGSDWHMINTQVGFEDYPRTYMAGIRAHVPDAAARIGHANGLRFLGLDGTETKARSRLREFYHRHDMGRPTWWVSDWS
jgi:hypothetical protein